MAGTKTIEARFVEAWAGIENPELDSVNPHFKNKYASLKATQKVIREACKPQGIMYQQRLVECSDGGFRLHSYVKDSDGGTIELSAFPVETPPNPQAFGSEMTYKKRQQAQADWGIVGEEDEDGEAAAAHQQGSTTKNTSKPKTTQPKASGAAQRQSGRYDKLKQLKAQALELGITEEGMQGALGNILQGKALKDATDTELRVCEGAIASLIGDKRELLGLTGGNDVDQ